MYRYEEDDIDALGNFLLIGVVAFLCTCVAVAFLCTCVVVFIAWMGWLS